jgi:hypothetical protein
MYKQFACQVKTQAGRRFSSRTALKIANIGHPK